MTGCEVYSQAGFDRMSDVVSEGLDRMWKDTHDIVSISQTVILHEYLRPDAEGECELVALIC